MSEGSNASTSPQGGLENGNESKFRIISVHYADLELASISHFTGVPDYRSLSILSTPTVATANGRYHLVDGYHLAEKAYSEGQKHIHCQIITLPDDSETALAWVKSYLRMAALDGNASYSERGRNIVITRDFLLREGFFNTQHGGSRKGESFAEATERSIIKKLAKIFKRSERTIQNYLNHFKFLNQSCIEDLVEADLPKSFFEEIEPAKAAFIKGKSALLENSDLNDATTLSEIASSQVSDWQKSFDRKTGKVKLLVKPKSNQNRKAGIKAGEPLSKGNEENAGGMVLEVMGNDQQGSPAPSPNNGEGVKELFKAGHGGYGSAEDKDKGNNEDSIHETRPPAGQPKLDVIQGGNKSSEDEIDDVYISLDKLADDMKAIAKRRPSMELLEKELQEIFDGLLDLKVAVKDKLDAAPYEKLEKDAA